MKTLTVNQMAAIEGGKYVVQSKNECAEAAGGLCLAALGVGASTGGIGSLFTIGGLAYGLYSYANCVGW